MVILLTSWSDPDNDGIMCKVYCQFDISAHSVHQYIANIRIFLKSITRLIRKIRIKNVKNLPDRHINPTNNPIPIDPFPILRENPVLSCGVSGSVAVLSQISEAMLEVGGADAVMQLSAVGDRDGAGFLADNDGEGVGLLCDA